MESGRAKIIQAQKETLRGHYETPSKDKAKLVIDTALNTAPTTEAHRSVATELKRVKVKVMPLQPPIIFVSSKDAT